jgi:hypothetical protein
MQEATAASVLGNFDNARFSKDGVESTFFRRGDKFMVRTDGPDGKLTDYEISYTFGVYPLQQYLIPFPGGRYQVLPIAWDARPKGEGGQRWFHLYPKQKVDHRDPLHWTGVYHNWALQCAECHSTNLRKGYDPASQTYQTTFSEINVACEACHGPASAHVDWARQAGRPITAQDRQGLPSLKTAGTRRGNSPAKAPGRRPRSPGRPCRHEQLRRLSRPPLDAERRRKAGAPLEDSHRLAMLTAPELPCRRSAARRGLCLGLVPAEPDASERRHLHGLPRAAFAEAARRGQRAVHALSRAAEFDARSITSISPAARARSASPATCRRRTTW